MLRARTSALTRLFRPASPLNQHCSCTFPSPRYYTVMASSNVTSAPPDILQAIADQGAIVKNLKAQKGPKEDIDRELATLFNLKAQLANLTGQSADGGGKGKKKATKFNLKTPKGTKDWHPSDMLLRQSIFRRITDVFELHGGVTIDTPVFELKEILSGKYGEDSKLIYDLQDQGGELCSLRYDLTVPFARFLAMNGSQYPNIKRYHIAKVYRRDQPAMSKGRMREFYQCDFDIAGSYDAMIPDAECCKIACDVLNSLEIDNFTLKINHRKLLDGIFAVCGVPEKMTRSISSAVDKMDKMSWEDVRKEMTVEKGLDGDVADRIGEYVKLKGGVELVEKLSQDSKLVANKTAKEGLADMAVLFKYLDIYGVLDRISFDLSLARGLDYYTGIIYEAVTEGSAPPPLPAATTATAAEVRATKTEKAVSDQNGDEGEVDESLVGVGSIAGGGRYDELVGMFSGTTSSAGKIPCVGISFGVERLFSLMLKKAQESGAEAGRGKVTEVFVMSLGDSLLEERMKVCKELWAAGIKAEFMYKVKAKAANQFGQIDKDRIPFAVIVSPDELSNGDIRIKPQVGKDEGSGNGILMKRGEMIGWLKERIARSEA